MDGSFIPTSEEVGVRLDQFLTNHFPGQSRAYFQGLISQRAVLVNGNRAKKREKLRRGDTVAYTLLPSPLMEVTPEPIPLDILYEDGELIVVNKPADLVIHPGSGNWSGTFANALLYHCKQLPGKETLRPGIVHRLDKETSGVLIAAKTEHAHRNLIEQFAERSVKKEYLALSVGDPGKITINTPLGRHPIDRKKWVCKEGGKPAITHVHMVSKSDGICLLKIGLETGRTHQIRVHLKSVGTPVLGDPLYGDKGMNQKWKVKRQMLHAHRLELTHPVSGEKTSFSAPIPPDFCSLCSNLQVAL